MNAFQSNKVRIVESSQSCRGILGTRGVEDGDALCIPSDPSLHGDKFTLYPRKDSVSVRSWKLAAQPTASSCWNVFVPIRRLRTLSIFSAPHWRLFFWFRIFISKFYIRMGKGYIRIGSLETDGDGYNMLWGRYPKLTQKRLFWTFSLLHSQRFRRTKQASLSLMHSNCRSYTFISSISSKRLRLLRFIRIIVFGLVFIQSI